MIRALDGSQLEIDGLPGETTGWAFRAWYSNRRGGMSVIASTDAGANENSPLPDATIVSEAQSGTARLLALADRSNEQHPITLFVYQGAFHELYTSQAGVDIPLDVFVDFLKPLDITDTPEGIQALPKRGSGASVTLHLGGTALDPVAVITSYFTPQAIRDRPPHRGQSARGGELWRIDDPVAVLLANDSVATTIEPLGDRNDPTFSALAKTMRITRRSG